LNTEEFGKDVLKVVDLIYWYLLEFIFPEYMRGQMLLALSDSGQGVGGGTMQNDLRLGFPGAPYDLLTGELSQCCYETGSCGQTISVTVGDYSESGDAAMDGCEMEGSGSLGMRVKFNTNVGMLQQEKTKPLYRWDITCWTTMREQTLQETREGVGYLLG